MSTSEGSILHGQAYQVDDSSLSRSSVGQSSYSIGSMGAPNNNNNNNNNKGKVNFGKAVKEETHLFPSEYQENGNSSNNINEERDNRKDSSHSTLTAFAPWLTPSVSTFKKSTKNHSQYQNQNHSHNNYEAQAPPTPDDASSGSSTPNAPPHKKMMHSDSDAATRTFAQLDQKFSIAEIAHQVRCCCGVGPALVRKMPLSVSYSRDRHIATSAALLPFPLLPLSYPSPFSLCFTQYRPGWKLLCQCLRQMNFLTPLHCLLLDHPTICGQSHHPLRPHLAHFPLKLRPHPLHRSDLLPSLRVCRGFTLALRMPMTIALMSAEIVLVIVIATLTTSAILPATPKAEIR